MAVYHNDFTMNCIFSSCQLECKVPLIPKVEKQFQVGNLAKTFGAEHRACCVLRPYLWGIHITHYCTGEGT